MIDCPSIININRLIDIDCHRLLSTAIDYRFHRLFRSWISLLWELNSFSCKFFEKNLYCCDLQQGRLLPWLQTKNYFIFNCCFNLTCYYATTGIPPGFAVLFVLGGLLTTPRHAERDNSPSQSSWSTLYMCFGGTSFQEQNWFP